MNKSEKGDARHIFATNAQILKEVCGVFFCQIQKGGAAGMYFMSGKSRAFEMLMQGKPDLTGTRTAAPSMRL